MTKRIEAVFRQANRISKSMKNRETKIIPNTKINGVNAVIYKAKNGMVNVIGASYKNGIARYSSDGKKFSISRSEDKIFGKARKLVFSGGAKYKKGSTGSRGG